MKLWGKKPKLAKRTLKIKLAGQTVKIILTGEKNELLNLDTEVWKIEGVLGCLSKINKSVHPDMEKKIVVHFQCQSFCGFDREFCRKVITLMERELTEKMQKRTRIDTGGFVDFDTPLTWKRG